MFRSLLRGSALLALAITLFAEPAPGGAADDFKLEDGYKSLFNGKDLSGWTYRAMPKDSLENKTETADKRFEVKDGIIIVNEGKGVTAIDTAQSLPAAFHLKLEFRAAPKADSGVYIRGPQLQVRDYPTVGPYKDVKFNKGDWNELEITVTSPVYSAKVNGKDVGDKDVLELTFKDGKPVAKLNGKEVDVGNIQVQGGPAALCKCNGEMIEKAFPVPDKGGIGLQAETGKFEFRRIRVKDLTK